MQYLNNFKRIYSLLYFFTLKELKERYKQAYFGFAWMLLVPIVTMATFYFIFTKIFPIEVKNYPIYLLSGLAPWFFFSNGVTQNTTALSGNANLIRKTVFPKHLLILANLNSNFFSYIFSLALISLYLIMSTGFQFRFFLYIPLSLCFFAYSFFFSAPLSYLYIKYRDIKPISDLFIFLLFYATPLFYSINQVPLKHQWILYFNPVHAYIFLHRSIVYGDPIHKLVWISGISWSVFALFVFLFIYKKMDQNISDYVR